MEWARFQGHLFFILNLYEYQFDHPFFYLQVFLLLRWLFGLEFLFNQFQNSLIISFLVDFVLQLLMMPPIFLELLNHFLYHHLLLRLFLNSPLPPSLFGFDTKAANTNWFVAFEPVPLVTFAESITFLYCWDRFWEF